MDIKKLRKNKGFTQLETAKRVGVSYAAYRLWEAGVSNPNADNLKKLKQVLGVELGGE